MCYKKFEPYIILCLIKQISMIPYVSDRPTNGEEMNIISDCQLEEFANEVCSNAEIIFVNVTMKICMENFWAPDPSIPKSEVVKIKCQTNLTTNFQIEPSKSWQLIALVPHFSDCNIEYNPVIFSLVEPYHEFIDITITRPKNYAIWSTILDEGSPVKWRRGDKLPLYNASAVPEHRSYDINGTFYSDMDSISSTINVRFTWNTSGDGDGCFAVVNTCDNTGLDYVHVGPNNKFQPQAVFKNLLMDNECDIEVKGVYGSTKITYRTPYCDSKDNCTDISLKPEMPDNIYIKATPDSLNTWMVRVVWAPPKHEPEWYNVTLYTNTTQISQTSIPGDQTEAVFLGVVGDWIYDVSVEAVKGHLIAHTSRRAEFPVRRLVGWRGGGAGSAGAAAACVLAAAVALLCRCRRRRYHLAVPDYTQDDKPPKDRELDALDVWNEPEDKWEVRADKLMLHEVIGEGAFGVVRRATLAPHSKQVAVKMLKDFPSLEEIRSFRSEMELMKSVGAHPHLVSLVGCCTGRRPLIVAEYCSRGDLLSYLRYTWDIMVAKRNAKYHNNNIENTDYRHNLFKSSAQKESSKLVVNKLYDLQGICDKELTALDILSFCRQISMGMEFLAANRVVHRDLAARNVLVTADKTLKIADFGLSRDVYEENQYKQKGNGKMPIKWMALESLTRKIYTTQSDVWSFGVVMWELATVGGAPYASVPAPRLPRLLRAGYRMPRPNNCSPMLYDIMLSCWRTHPRERPTFAELHQQLDELLSGECAHNYLSLEIDPDDGPPTPKQNKYIKMLTRGKRNWSRGENYERPLNALPTISSHNHYTSPPQPDPQSTHAQSV